jgi:predicted O-linked N-acetylglucosamine transferase (SPINDLY family)
MGIKRKIKKKRDKQQFLERAVQHHRAGRLQEAELLYRKILSRTPSNPDALHYLGVLAHQHGRYEEAVNYLEKSLAKAPDNGDALNNLGITLRCLTRHREALSCFKRAVALNPDSPEVHNNLANAFRKLGETDRAITSYLRAVSLNPGFTQAHNNLGNIQRQSGRFDEALVSYKTALDLKPGDPGIHNNIGVTLQLQGRLGDALASFNRALESAPEYPEGLNNLGNLLMEKGMVDEASGCYKKAISIKPGFSEAHSNLLLNMNYSSKIGPHEMAAAHKQWAARYVTDSQPVNRGRDCDFKKKHCLRVGYVSPDFKRHPVSCFIEPILANHDQEHFKIFCYANMAMEDSVTARLKALPVTWRNIHPLSDNEAADLIVRDSIDILVDLAGHTQGNRLLLFGRKPAPIQVTYLGYPNTTGLLQMDYRITDGQADPPGISGDFCSEEIVRLAHGFLCYQPVKDSPDPSALPALSNGFVTFGSFNNLAKTTPQVIKIWAEILLAVPNSRLIMKYKSLADNDTRKRVHAMFKSSGIDNACERIELLGFIPNLSEHLKTSNRIDLALDTFPYNGTTTTCEALWMGVPVITLAGENHSARVGASIMSQVNLFETITGKSEEYLETAVGLATDTNRLARLRSGLRDTVSQSPLTNQALFVNSLETAYRKMWEKWCMNRPC